jgi:phosphoribosylformylglycinamidine synthase
MLGLIENKSLRMTLDFKNTGDIIFMIGASKNDINSSEYLYSFHKIKNSPAPFFDIDEEISVHKIIRKLISKGMIESAHDVSDGGLFITLAESAMPNNLGFSIETDFDCRADAFLFGEAQSRVVVSVKPEKLDSFVNFIASSDIEFSNLGVVTEGAIMIDEVSFGHISEAKGIYENALGDLMEIR